MGPEQDSLRPPSPLKKAWDQLDKVKLGKVRVVCPPNIRTEPRSGHDIETELMKLMVEYLAYCNKTNTLSFQGGISELAWEVENDPED